MSTQQNQSKDTDKKIGKSEELKTDSPMSEKDEVKAAEQRTAKSLKKDQDKPKAK